MARIDLLEMLIVHNLNVDAEQMICLDCGEIIEGEKEINTQIDRMIEFDFIKRHKGASRYLSCKELKIAEAEPEPIVTKQTARDDFVEMIEVIFKEDRIDMYVKNELMNWLTNVFDKIK